MCETMRASLMIPTRNLRPEAASLTTGNIDLVDPKEPNISVTYDKFISCS